MRQQEIELEEIKKAADCARKYANKAQLVAGIAIALATINLVCQLTLLAIKYKWFW